MNLTSAKLLAQIQSIRTDSEIFLTDTAQIKRRTGETYTNGASTPVYDDPETIACRLITRSGSESQNIAAQAREIQQTAFTGLYRMQVAYDLVVSETDHILYTDKVTNEVKEFEVIFSPAKHGFTGAVIIFLQEQK
jgi:hypothetical protein